jgi:hypothetical protein
MPNVVLYVPEQLYRNLDQDKAKIRHIARAALEKHAASVAKYTDALNQEFLPATSGKSSYAPDWK